MKKFTTQLVSMLLLAFCVSTAYAKQGGEFQHRDGQDRMLEKMQEHLQLSEEQVEQIRTIREASGLDLRKTMKGLMRTMMQLDPSSPDYQSDLEKLAKLQASQIEAQIVAYGEMRAKVHAVLTPEQQQKSRELHEKMSEMMGKRHKYGKQNQQGMQHH